MLVVARDGGAVSAGVAGSVNASSVVKISVRQACRGHEKPPGKPPLTNRGWFVAPTFRKAPSVALCEAVVDDVGGESLHPLDWSP